MRTMFQDFALFNGTIAVIEFGYEDGTCVVIVDAWRKTDENLVHPPKLTISPKDDERFERWVMANRFFDDESARMEDEATPRNDDGT